MIWAKRRYVSFRRVGLYLVLPLVKGLHACIPFCVCCHARAGMGVVYLATSGFFADPHALSPVNCNALWLSVETLCHSLLLFWLSVETLCYSRLLLSLLGH